MSTASHLISAFKQFCSKSGFPVHQIGQSTFLAINSGGNGKWPIFCHLRGTRITFSSALPVTVPPAKQQAVMEYLTRANYGLFLGNFELDLDDGEVCYKTSLDIADGKLTSAMLGHLLAANLATTDRYLKGLLQILLTDMSPAAVIQIVEETEETAPDADELRKLLEDVDLDRLPKQGDD